MTAKNIENLIKNSQFPDPDYKSRLRKQLFENDTRLINQEAFSEKDGEEISMDELDAVAGGRDWLEKGCKAAVEPGSDCWGTDGGCTLINIQYEHMPVKDMRCPKCGAYVCKLGNLYWKRGEGLYGDWVTFNKYQCRKCGPFTVDIK